MNAQSITIDSMSIGNVIYVEEEVLNDSTIVIHNSSTQKPEIVLFINSDSLEKSCFTDTSFLFCEFVYNGKEYSVPIGFPSYIIERTKTIVLMDSHLFDNILSVQSFNGIFDYYNAVLEIMKTFSVVFYVNDQKKYQSNHPRILTIYD